jgi:lipopolysaccharide heptosyltransferase I
MPKPSNILVIRLSSLGDVLMSMPAVKSIKDHFPESRISWLVEGSVGDLLSSQPFIDEVIPFPRGRTVQALRHGHLGLARIEMSHFLKRLRKDRFDMVVDFHGIIKSTLFSLCARGGKRVGFDRMYAKEKSHLFYHERVGGHDRRLHKVEKNMLLPRHLGAKGAVPEIDLLATPEAAAYIDRYFEKEGISSLSPVFAVNPFSSKGSSFKRWDIHRYARLIGRIRNNTPAQIIILWGPGEEDEARSLQKDAGDRVFLSCPTNVPELLALMKKVDMYIGGDTGVMHLAAFARTPVVAIFGPTDVKINGPYSRKSTVVRRELTCSPCKNKQCEERKCLSGISVDQVYDAILAMEQTNRRN